MHFKQYKTYVLWNVLMIDLKQMTPRRRRVSEALWISESKAIVADSSEPEKYEAGPTHTRHGWGRARFAPQLKNKAK
jgi:hypothetical protein